jgi:hypothetical protein
MGWTNSVPIFHDDITFILQAKILHVTIPYIDDVPIKGLMTMYQKVDEFYKTIPVIIYTPHKPRNAPRTSIM